MPEVLVTSIVKFLWIYTFNDAENFATSTKSQASFSSPTKLMNYGVSKGIFHHILVCARRRREYSVKINLSNKKNVYKLKLEQTVFEKFFSALNMISFLFIEDREEAKHSSDWKECKGEEKSTTNNYVNLRNYFWQACALKFLISSLSSWSRGTI